jgi:hypothetical protein
LPNLRYEIPEDLRSLATVLKGVKIARIEIQHILDIDERILEVLRALRLPYDAYVHD